MAATIRINRDADRRQRHFGALSRIDDTGVRTALALAKAGRIYDLGLEAQCALPHNPEFVRFAMSFTHTPEGTGAFPHFSIRSS